MEQRPAAGTAESSHLKSQAKGREHPGNDKSLLKLQSLPLIINNKYCLQQFTPPKPLQTVLLTKDKFFKI